jgi:hypothetical protein
MSNNNDDDTKTITVSEQTYQRFQEARKETKTQHVPAMNEDDYLASLLDTQSAVRDGYYSNV